jgi:hypothetical protein
MASAKIFERINKTRRIYTDRYSITKIVEPKRRVEIEEIIPFRIRLTNIGIPGYSSTNIPGIGLQIIGISNYIL